jgi:hypothetical protein
VVRNYDLAAKGADPDGGRVYAPHTLRKQNGMPFTVPFSPHTIRWRRAAIVELRKLGIDLEHPG